MLGHRERPARGRRAARRPGDRVGARDGARARHRPGRRLDRRARRRAREAAQHLGARRSRRRDRGRLPQAAHVRRRGRRHALPRVRARGAGRRDRRSRRPPTASSSGMSVCYDLRFPELYRILAVRGARVLAVPAAFTLATTRDHWEMLLRARAIENQAFVIARQPDRRAPAAGMRSGGRSMIVDPWGWCSRRRPTARATSSPSSTSSAPADMRERAARRCATPPARELLRLMADRSRRRGRQAPPDPRRRRARVRAPGLPRLPRVGHRRRGGRRLRPRLPLLPLQGRGARHALPRALERDARRDPRDRRAGDPGAREARTRSRRSSSTPTATTPT